MKRYITAALCLIAVSATAQETYQNAIIAEGELNGTARYVGMGGAMEALGADISTINTNPAGIGLIRRSQAAVTFGVVSQQDAPQSKWGDATVASFDQAGFVYSSELWSGNRLNFAFNYKKNRNFNQILSAVGGLNDASQNKLSYMKIQDAYANMGDDFFDAYTYSRLEDLYLNTFIEDREGYWGYSVADRYALNRAQKGYIGEYSFNVSGNVSDKFYLGLTLGVHDVHYSAYTEYSERILNSSDDPAGSITTVDSRDITGSGYDFRLGAIVFPIEDSPFRIGMHIATPTFYDLTSQSSTYLVNDCDKNVLGYIPANPNFNAQGSYDFKVFTPWKFGISLGHTIGGHLALGASYEYSDYGCIKSRYIEGYDYYGESTSSNDNYMNMDTERNLKGVSTLKLGAEVKVSPELAVRVGYNYVSPMYNKDGYRDPWVESDGNYFASSTDYTNWTATNRLTCGVGFSKGNFFADAALQYQVKKGEFHPFADSYLELADDNGNITESLDNYADAVNVDFKRVQAMLTLGYKF